MADQKIGELLDGMDVTLDIGEGQQITAVFIVAKLIDLNTGGTAMTFGSNEGVDWLAQLALMQGADIVLRRELNESL